MNVSSYLEGFLTIYGWMLYETLYQLMSMLWLIFLPFLMLAFNFFRDTVTDNSYLGYGHFKKSMFTFIFMLLTIFTCVVPLDTITIENTKVNAVCVSSEEMKNLYEKTKEGTSDSYHFSGSEKGKVPMLVSLVMRIGQGTNNVIFRATPCVASVSNMSLAFNSAKINDAGLKSSMGLFTDACWKPAATRIGALEKQIGTGFVQRLAKQFAKKEGTSINQQKNYMGSGLMQMMMQGGEGYSSELNAVASGSERKIFREIMNAGGSSVKLYSADSVEGVSSDHPDRSEQQKATGKGPVSCKRWWSHLRPKLVDDAYTSVAYVADQDKAINCKWTSNSASPGGIIGFNSESLVEGSCSDVDDFFNAKTAEAKKKFGDKVVWGAQSVYTGGIASTEDQARNLDRVGVGATILGVIGLVFPVGDGVLSSITSSATSFYAEMYMYKTVARFLQPMLLMGIYMFWLIYLIVSSYRGETIFKGLVLIFALTILPGIWGIADHLDSNLYQALFPNNDIAELASRKNPTIERIILDAASTAFYIIFPFILLYLISEAGGPRGDRAVQGADKQSQNIGQVGGGVAGKQAGRATSSGIGKIKSSFGGGNK